MSEDDMLLPVGMTCGDCVHIARCKAMFGHVETDTYCDWSPSRFQTRKGKGSMTLDDELIAHFANTGWNGDCHEREKWDRLLHLARVGAHELWIKTAQERSVLSIQNGERTQS